MSLERVTVPDFGGVQKITVIEVLVKPGDTVEQEGALIVLESEKAVMEIPSPFAGTIRAVQCKVGDTVKGGDLIAEIEAGEGALSTEEPIETAAQTAPPPPAEAQPVKMDEAVEPAAPDRKSVV